MKITLKDGSVREYSEPMTVNDIAFDISGGLGRAACAGEIDGEVVDLRTTVDKDCTLNILTFKDEVNESELQLLRYGRHFRTADNNKIIVARTKEEGEAIKTLVNKEYLSFHAAEFSGALVLLEGNGTESDKVLAARMAARYSKGREQDKIKIKYGIYGRKLDNYIEVEPISDSELEQFIISIK